MTSYVNIPKPFTKSDYEEAVSEAVDRLRRLEYVKSVYRAGGDWLPGISDIDLMVVFRSDMIPDSPIFSQRRLSDKAAYCFAHNFGTYDEESFQNLFYIIPDITKLEVRYGAEISVARPREQLSSAEYKSLQAIIIFDLIVSKLWRFFLYRTCGDRIDVRKAISEFYSLTYTLKMAERANMPVHAGTFTRDMTDLRARWFHRTNEENFTLLRILVEDGIRITALIIEALSERTVRMSPALLDAPAVCLQSGPLLIEFVKDWSYDRMQTVLDKDARSIFGRTQYRVLLPHVLAGYLMVYVHSGSTFGDRLGKRLSRIYDIPKGFRGAGSELHASFLSHLWYTSYRHNGSLKVPFHFGIAPKPMTVRRYIRDFVFAILASISRKKS